MGQEKVLSNKTPEPSVQSDVQPHSAHRALAGESIVEQESGGGVPGTFQSTAQQETEPQEVSFNKILAALVFQGSLVQVLLCRCLRSRRLAEPPGKSRSTRALES